MENEVIEKFFYYYSKYGDFVKIIDKKDIYSIIYYHIYTDKEKNKDLYNDFLSLTDKIKKFIDLCDLIEGIENIYKLENIFYDKILKYDFIKKELEKLKNEEENLSNLEEKNELLKQKIDILIEVIKKGGFK